MGISNILWEKWSKVVDSHTRKQIGAQIIESKEQPLRRTSMPFQWPSEIEQNNEPVDRGARVLTDGSPVTEDHREINPATGQQNGYVVLSAEERAKGFSRPVRREYTHTGAIREFENSDHPSGKTQKWSQRSGGCGTDTAMTLPLAETYARDREFYSGTFCVYCRAHFPLDQFVWKDTDEQVGS